MQQKEKKTEETLKPEHFFDLSNFEYKEIFDGLENVWDLFKKDAIHDFITKLHKHKKKPNVSQIRKINGSPVLRKTFFLYNGKVFATNQDFKITKEATSGKITVKIGKRDLEDPTIIYAGAVLFSKDIFLGEGTIIESGALIKGPVIVGNHTRILQAAYIRKNVIIGDNCVLGHASEIKNSIMLDDSKASHFAYIGDCIIGGRVNLGAGTRLANLNFGGTPVKIKIGKVRHIIPSEKIGAILGDDVETGCNCVCNPGVLLGKNCWVFPNVSAKPGYYGPNTKVRLDIDLINKEIKAMKIKIDKIAKNIDNARHDVHTEIKAEGTSSD